MTPPDAPDPIPEPREPGCAVAEHGGEGGDVVAQEPIEREDSEVRG